MDQSNNGLLAGVKVLEFCQFFAGPTASRMMADMGAEVVKVEFGPHGDHLRGYPPLKAGQSGIFMLENRGKESLCLDIEKDEGKRIARELAAKVDVLIENYSPGVLNRRGRATRTCASSTRGSSCAQSPRSARMDHSAIATATTRWRWR